MRIFATLEGYAVDPATKDKAEDMGEQQLVEVENYGEAMVKVSAGGKPLFFANREDLSRALDAVKAGNGRLF